MKILELIMNFLRGRTQGDNVPVKLNLKDVDDSLVFPEIFGIANYEEFINDICRNYSEIARECGLEHISPSMLEESSEQGLKNSIRKDIVRLERFIEQLFEGEDDVRSFIPVHDLRERYVVYFQLSCERLIYVYLTKLDKKYNQGLSYVSLFCYKLVYRILVRLREREGLHEIIHDALEPLTYEMLMKVDDGSFFFTDCSKHDSFFRDMKIALEYIDGALYKHFVKRNFTPSSYCQECVNTMFVRYMNYEFAEKFFLYILINKEYRVQILVSFVIFLLLHYPKQPLKQHDNYANLLTSFNDTLKALGQLSNFNEFLENYKFVDILKSVCYALSKQ